MLETCPIMMCVFLFCYYLQHLNVVSHIHDLIHVTDTDNRYSHLWVRLMYELFFIFYLYKILVNNVLSFSIHYFLMRIKLRCENYIFRVGYASCMLIDSSVVLINNLNFGASWSTHFPMLWSYMHNVITSIIYSCYCKNSAKHSLLVKFSF